MNSLNSTLAVDYSKILLFDVIPSELEKLVGEGAYALALKLSSSAVIKLVGNSTFNKENIESIIMELFNDLISSIEKDEDKLIIHTRIDVSDDAQKGALAGLFVGLLKAMGCKAIAPKRPIYYANGYVIVKVDGDKVVIDFPSTLC